MNHIELVIFDLDGTLVDTAVDVHICLNAALQAMRLPQISMQLAKKAIGPGPKDFIKYVLGEENRGRAEEFHAAFRPIYQQHCADHAEPFDGILPLLNELKERGVKIVVATNKARKDTDIMLAVLDLEFYFDAILSRDDVAHPKPEPDMLLEACRRLHVLPEAALMLGDTDNDILSGRAAGIKSCLALWGYSDHFDELKKISTYSAEHPLDVLDIVESEITTHV